MKKSVQYTPEIDLHTRWDSAMAMQTIDKSIYYLYTLGLVFILLALMYSYLTPLFEGPDSGAHFRYIGYLNQQQQLPHLDKATAKVSHELIQQPPLYYSIVMLLSAGGDMDAAINLEQPNPYSRKGLSQRAVVSPLDAPWSSQMPIWIARITSLLGGLLTLIMTWFLVLEFFPKQYLLAAAAASTVGFNPQFLFSSATITNDTWAAAMATFAVWWAVHTSNKITKHSSQTISFYHWFGVGILCGLAALAKYSGLLILFPVAVIVFATSWHRSWSFIIQVSVACAAGFMIVAGYWYGQNLYAWGELVPLTQMLTLLPGLAYETPLPFSELMKMVEWLMFSYWGVFGYGILAPSWFYDMTQILTWSGTAGLLIWPIRQLYRYRKDRLNSWEWYPLAVLLLWFATIFFSLLNWMRLVAFADQGRLLFPAATAVGILLALGWQAWLPNFLQMWGLRIIPLIFIGLATSQLTTLHKSYRVPTALTASITMDREIQARFQPGMHLLGVDLPNGAAIETGGQLPLTFYWSTDQPISEFYTLFIHLTGADDQMLFQFDGVPAQGRHATAQWKPGVVFADSYTIKVDDIDISEDGLAILSMGFYDYATPSARQAVLSTDGQIIGDRIVLTPIRLHSKASNKTLYPTAPVAKWDNQITLQQYEMRRNESDTVADIDVVWYSENIIHTDYTVFIHILDAENRLLAQYDQQPDLGRYPTSTWRRGDLIQESYHFEDLPLNWQQIILGFYDHQTSTRVQRIKADLSNSQPTFDYYILSQR